VIVGAPIIRYIQIARVYDKTSPQIDRTLHSRMQPPALLSIDKSLQELFEKKPCAALLQYAYVTTIYNAGFGQRPTLDK
jgi:hypothetical protein